MNTAVILFLLLSFGLSIILLVTRHYYQAGLSAMTGLGCLIALTLLPLQKEVVYITASPETRSYAHQLEELSTLKAQHNKVQEELAEQSNELAKLQRKAEQQKTAQREIQQKKTASNGKATDSQKKTTKLSELIAKAFGQSADPVDYKSSEFNFQVTLPKDTAKVVKPEKLNKLAKFAINYTGKESYGLILPELGAADMVEGHQDYQDLTVANFSGVGKKFTHLGDNTQTFGGLEFKQSELQLTLNKYELFYITSSILVNGDAYQILVWGSQDDKENVRKNSTNLLKGFSLLDPNKKFVSAFKHGSLTDLTPAEFPCSFALSELKAVEIEDFLELTDNTLAGYKTSPRSFSYIYMIDLGTPKIPERYIGEGILHESGLEVDSDECVYLGKTEHQGHPMHTYGYRFEDDDGKLNFCKLEVLKHGSTATAILTNQPNPAQLGAPTPAWSTLSWNKQHASPSSDKQRLVYSANLLNSIGLIAYIKEDYSVAKAAFRNAYTQDPAKVTYANNVVETHIAAGEFSSALQTAEQITEDFPKNISLKLKKAECLRELDRVDESFTLYEEVFLGGHRDDDILLECLNAMIAAETYQRGVDFMQAYEKQHSNEKMKRWLASMLSSNDQDAEAIQILNGILEESPKNESAISLLVDSLSATEQYDQAHQWVKKLQKIDPNHIDYQLDEARLLRSQKLYQKAYDLLKTLSQKYPNDSETQRLFTMSSAKLGLGDHSTLHKEIPAISLPETIATLENTHAKVAHPDEDDHSSYYHHDIVGIHYEESGRYTQTRYLKYTVTTSRGVENFKNWVTSFDPTSEDIYINKHIIYAPSGEIAHRGKVTEYHLTDEESSMVTHSKELTLPNIGLEIGSTVELVYTKRSWYGKDHPFPHKQFWMQSTRPERFCALFVTGQHDDLIFHSSQPIAHEKTAEGQAWWHHHSPVYHREGYTPDPEELLTRLSIGSNAGNWKNVSKEYYEHIAERFSDDPQLAAEIDSILAPHASQEEKVKAAIHWVQQFCKYRGLEFGPRGRMPKPALATLKGREGDCKDMSLLLWHMLKKIGLSPQLALANTDDPIIKSMPDENQFNHIVLYCPELKNNPVLDPTYEHLDLFSTPPYALNGYYILPISKTGSELFKVQSTADSSNKFTIHRRVVTEDNKLKISEDLKVRGYAAAYLRSNLQGMNKKEQRARLHSWFSASYPDISIASLNIVSGINKTSEDLQLTLEYTYPKAKNRRLLPVPWERYYFETSQANARVNPIECRTPTHFETTTHFADTLKYSTSNTAASNKFIQFDLKQDKQSLQYTSVRKAGKAAAKSYPEFQSQLNSLVPAIQIESE